MRDGGEIDNGVCERVGAAKGEDDAWWTRWVGEGNVAAGVSQQRSRIPCLQCTGQLACDNLKPYGCFQKVSYFDQLKVLEFRAPTETLERLLDAQTGASYTVGYVDDAGKFFELGEELHG